MLPTPPPRLLVWSISLDQAPAALANFDADDSTGITLITQF
ncbi:hypothetical protein [Euzebya tangerina]|nr:hypothetical protein [Euzebya tangerina]